MATTFDWLDARRDGLALEFELEFFAAVLTARTRPDSFAADHTGYRPIRLKKYSAVLYFTIELDTVVIAGVFMGGRSEANLKNRR